MSAIKNLTTYLSIIILLFCALWLNAQSKVKFAHLTTEEGMISDNVRVISQDYQQFIWLGTENGLLRYDGYEFKTYQSKEGNDNSIGGNFILSLYEDSRQNFWIGTLDHGLSLYNRPEDSFNNFVHSEEDSTSILGNTISSFYETPDGILWMTIQQGGLSYIDLNTFDPESPVFHNVSLPEYMIDAGWLWVRKMLPADNGKFWIGGHGFGLLKFDPDTRQFERYLSDPEKGPVLPDKRVTNIYKDKMGRLWLGTWGSGLFAYYPEEQKLIHYPANGKRGLLPSDQATELAMDNSGDFWIGTDDGLSRMLDFDEKYPKGDFQNFQSEEFDENSLLTNAVKALFVDNRNRLWAATYFGGVNIYDRDYFRFNTIRHHPLVSNSLPGNNVSAIEEDASGNLWIGTDNNGFCKLPDGSSNPEKNNFRLIPLKNSINGTNEKKIKCLEIDREGNIWIGTWGGGMFSYHPESKDVRHYLYNEPEALPSESVFAIESDSAGNLWIGTFSGGLAYYDTHSGKYDYYKYSINDSTTIGNNKINTIFIDSKHSVWVGTEGGGLNLFRPGEKAFSRIDLPGLKSTYNILSIYEDSVGCYWVGTHANGLLRYNHNEKHVKAFDQRHRLLSNMIYAITEDKHGNLWLSTNKGLSQLAAGDTTFTNYSRMEGLQTKQFNANSVLTSKTGRLIFGGVNGMNAFFPDEISKNPYEPKVVFTDLWIDNVSQSVRVEGSPLQKNIVIADRINLNHHQNSFSIEYAALEYDFAKRSQYMAYLEGFDNDWLNKGYERKVTYTNLNPGKYKLHVKAINKDGFIAENHATLQINIIPAWYQTVVFKLLIITLLAGMVMLVVRLRFRFLLQQKHVLEEKVTQRTYELNEKNNEILAQNEELQAQNEQIFEQHEQLEAAKVKLQKLNNNLEKLVNERTEALEDTVQKLSKTVYELDRFVYSASHDLSAPLKSILGLIHVAKMDAEPDRAIEYMEHIENSINKLEDVIQSLVSYSRNSRLEVDHEQIPLRKLVHEVANELAFLASGAEVKIDIDISMDSIIITDRQRLTTILHNLISNCLKYIDLNKSIPFIEISHYQEHGSHCLMVRDNGIGIEPDQKAKIFDMFYRATEKSSGSGLGLYIVKETLTALKGTIEVESEPGEGTTFKIYLPVKTRARENNV